MMATDSADDDTESVDPHGHDWQDAAQAASIPVHSSEQMRATRTKSTDSSAKIHYRMCRRLVYLGCFWAVGILVLSLIILIALVVFVVHKRNHVAIDLDRSESAMVLISSILGQDVSVSSEKDPALSQALTWIIQSDPLQISTLSPTFMQRFLAVWFYFGTSLDPNFKWNSCGSEVESSVTNGTTDTNTNTNLCRWEDFMAIDYMDYPDVKTSYRWLSNVSECLWAGVRCDSQSQIRRIELNGQHLSGSFPTILMYFPFMNDISLWSNNMTGSLPLEFWSRAVHLIDIKVQYNNFTGTIPSELWLSTKLKSLALGGNFLTSMLSSEVRKLNDLKELFLDGNNLTGSIPSELGYIPSLSVIRLDSNQFQGSIPTSLSNLNSLHTLGVSNNQLQGTLPSLINATTLFSLDFSTNNFIGSIPTAWYNSSQLYHLNISNNALTGSLSSSIASLHNLAFMFLHDNQMTGFIPTLMSNMTGLYHVELHHNNFEGSVPSGVCQLFDKGPNSLHFLTADCSVANGTAKLACDCCTLCCDAVGTCVPTTNESTMP